MNKKKKNTNDKPIPYKITPAGSLGVLALGHVGIDAWREAKKKRIKK